MNERNDEGLRNARRRFLRRALGVGGAVALGQTVGCERATKTSATQPPAPSEPTGDVQAEQTRSEAGTPALPEGQDLSKFIVHSMSPITAETRREYLGTSVVTASSLLFIRQNLPLPSADILRDRAGWRFDVLGVKAPRSVTLSELQTLGLETVATVLQCSGNGRAYYEHSPSGSQWGVGAAGCAIWSGVPVRKLVEHLGGVVSGARYMTTTGGEPLPEGVERDKAVVERSVPLDKAVEDCLLAWEMNGEPIPLSHGGPLRLIVPGYFGCNQIKFVKRLAFTEAQASAKIQQTGYRMRPIGEPGSPDQPAMWAMGVKSFITRPTARTPVTAGKIQVTGVAFGGDEAVAEVEISRDGKSWTPARFVGPDLGPYAWRLFHAEIEADAGSLPLFSRATSKSGKVQPEQRRENERGYGNSSWRDMGVVLRVCAAGDATCLEPPNEQSITEKRKRTTPVVLSEQGERGRRIFTELAQPGCPTCHALEHARAGGVVGPNLDDLGPSIEQIETAVQNGVGAMPAFGQTLTAEQVEDVARYVYEATH